MAFQTVAFYHLSVLFILSIMVFPLKRSSLVALLLVVPALTEIVQFFLPSRVPDFMDAFHGYLGILLAFCLVQMWREIAPVVKKIADFGFFKREKRDKGQKSEIRRQRSGVKLISDLRLLTSVIDDFNGLNDFYDFYSLPPTAHGLPLTIFIRQMIWPNRSTFPEQKSGSH